MTKTEKILAEKNNVQLIKITKRYKRTEKESYVVRETCDDGKIKLGTFDDYCYATRFYSILFD